MTTAPPIPYPMMEVPAMEDSMEMASPYQGHADDFDIDIDLMEDNVSNMDSDMMGADEFTNASQHNEPNNDAIYDADMADEPSEGSMIDADNYANEDNNIDVQFEQEPYEEEMIEPDPVEEVGHTVPSIHVEPMVSNEHAASPIREDPTITTAEPLEAAPQGSSDIVDIVPAKDEARVSGVEESHTQTEPSTVDGNIVENPSENVNDTEGNTPDEKPVLDEQANEKPQTSASENEVQHISHEGSEANLAENPILESKVDATGQSEAEPVSENNQQAAAHDESLRQITYPDEPLHPVKILYQDCEIALFPPLEGDSAETFFLQDEDVAYDNIGQLFKHLRQVLEKTLGNDVLVIDIDTLGVQITEDSSYTSQVTLYQILDLYLRLCRNDGTNEPDALYLTLSSKRAFSDEILELNAAAIAGKTLSELQAEIHSWNEYDEPEPGSEDLAAHGAEEHEDEIYYTHEAQQEYSGIDEQAAPGDAAKISARDQSQVPAHDVHNVQQGIINPPDDSTSVSAERAVEAVSVSNTGSPAQLLDSEQRGQPEQSEQIAAENAHQHDDVHDDIPEEHYDSEGPQSDSTATIAGFIVEKGVKQEPQDVSPEITEAAAEQNEHENHYPEDVENDDLGPDEYREEEHITSLEDLESSHTDIAGLENDDVGTPKPADETHILDQEDEDELDAPPTNELVSGTPLQNKNIDPSHDQTASLPGSGLQAPSDNNHQTPEPAEDFFEIAEDFLQTPPRGTEHDDLDHFEGIDYEDPNDELATPDAADGEGINHDGFDGAHFGAYDTEFEESEAVELVGEDHSVTNSPKNSSTKRSREDEDHWDAVETTVDTKRRRSS